ncbi:MAG TPA: hypothetical protein VFG46_07205 [Chryseolinea sp.]|nr:hypothetical protein [Chryseolinea sp.]
MRYKRRSSKAENIRIGLFFTTILLRRDVIFDQRAKYAIFNAICNIIAFNYALFIPMVDEFY